jgi:hypothetical protein
MVYCGECGHKMLVQYKKSPRYICKKQPTPGAFAGLTAKSNRRLAHSLGLRQKATDAWRIRWAYGNSLRQQYGVPVCQFIPAQAVDAQVVAAFFEVMSPVELDAYERAMAVQQENLSRINLAQKQQLQRLRYEAQLAERQFRRVDPDNRLVAAELERRWEEALRALKQAENDTTQRRQQAFRPLQLKEELKAAFTNIGEHLPQVWKQLSRKHQKSLLRCLIDKIIVHRCQRDTLQLRIVWRGGDTTSQEEFYSSTANLLGTETGYSKKRPESDLVLIEEAIVKGGAADKVLSRINAYWKEQLKRGVQYKLVLQIQGNFDSDEREDIGSAMYRVIQKNSKFLKENIVTDQTMDYQVWVDWEQMTSSRDIYEALQRDFPVEFPQGKLSRISITGKLILAKIAGKED